MARLRILILVLAVAAASGAGCSLFWQDGDGSGPIVASTSWELRTVFLSGAIVDASELEDPATLIFGGSMTAGPSADFEAGEVHGFSGCNQYSGAYQFRRIRGNAGEAAFSDLVTTEMACTGLRDRVEGLLYEAFEYAATYEKTASTLRIQVAADAPAPALTLVFARVP